MGQLGNRLLIEDVVGEAQTTDDLVATMRGEITSKEKVGRCAADVSNFLVGLFRESGGYGSIPWENSRDNESLLTVIVKVAQWVVKCRGTITVNSNFFGSEEEHSTVHIESPQRLISLLYSLAKGRAIASGRRSLATTDVQMVIRVALDSMPGDRRRVIRGLLRADGGGLASAEVQGLLNRSRPTAQKVMDALSTLGAVTRKQQGLGLAVSLQESEQSILEDAYKWVISRLP